MRNLQGADVWHCHFPSLHESIIGSQSDCSADLLSSLAVRRHAPSGDQVTPAVCGRQLAKPYNTMPV